MKTLDEEDSAEVSRKKLLNVLSKQPATYLLWANGSWHKLDDLDRVTSMNNFRNGVAELAATKATHALDIAAVMLELAASLFAEYGMSETSFLINAKFWSECTRQAPVLQTPSGPKLPNAPGGAA